MPLATIKLNVFLDGGAVGGLRYGGRGRTPVLSEHTYRLHLERSSDADEVIRYTEA